MNEKNNLKDNLIIKSDEMHKSLPMKKQFLFEDYSNTESIKNSEAYSEYDDEIISDREVNSYRPKKDRNNNYIFGVPNKSYSHKAVNNIIGFKFRKSKIFEDDDKKSRESYSATYHKVLNFSKRTHYILYLCNLLSFSINYEAIWRFPYYFIFAEWATFFIPFLIFYFLLGIPILTLESSLGQIFKSWPIGHFLSNKKKEYKYNFSINTIKILVLAISFIITLYFGSLVSQNIHYFFLAFSSHLPWAFQLDIDLILIFRMDITKHKFIYLFLCFGPIIIIILIFFGMHLFKKRFYSRMHLLFNTKNGTIINI